MLLLSSFFACRLVWGTYQSLAVCWDTWTAMNMGAAGLVGSHDLTSTVRPLFVPRNGELCLGDLKCIKAQMEIMKFSGPNTEAVPLWLAGLYLICNLTLNVLNFYWFGRMVETVSKRFQGKPHDEFRRERGRNASIVEEAARELEHDSMSGALTPEEMKQASSASGIDMEEKTKRRKHVI